MRNFSEKNENLKSSKKQNVHWISAHEGLAMFSRVPIMRQHFLKLRCINCFIETVKLRLPPTIVTLFSDSNDLISVSRGVFEHFCTISWSFPWNFPRIKNRPLPDSLHFFSVLRWVSLPPLHCIWAGMRRTAAISTSGSYRFLSFN